MPSSPVASSPKLILLFQKQLRKGWMRVFAQKRTRELAIELATTMLVLQARHTISASIIHDGDQDKAWNRRYRLFSMSPWTLRDLFRPCLEGAIARLPSQSQWLPTAIDDTKARKTGKKIPGVSYQRDPMSPPFHTNLHLALRFVQVCVPLPLYHEEGTRPRGIPVRFEHVPVLKKPGKKASPEEVAQWKLEKKTNNMSVHTGAIMRQVRQDADQAGAFAKQMMILGDGGYCNRNTFTAVKEIPRTDLLVRSRKDARLCRPAAAGTRKVYDDAKFTPEQVRTDEAIAWQKTSIHYGGQWRQIEFKRVDNVLWQRGASKRALTMFVLRPMPYKVSPNGNTCFRQPAYLLTTATTITSTEAIQMYCDRWQIEVCHREEKHDLGVGKAQVRSPKSVGRQPAFVVAAYAMAHLAALELYGAHRTSDYLPHPKWRKQSQRPSIVDITDVMRHELACQRQPAPNDDPQSAPTAVPSQQPTKQTTSTANSDRLVGQTPTLHSKTVQAGGSSKDQRQYH